MNMVEKQKFELFLSQLKETNTTLSFYSDFNKISNNVANISISLNMLNYLLGKDNLRGAVEDLWNRDKTVFDVMDILIATRKKDKKMYADNSGNIRLIHSLFDSVEGVVEFLTSTGLADVFRKREVKNLVDYVFGVETGLDSNARKNRSGKLIEDYLASKFKENGIPFKEQVSSSLYPSISTILGTDKKVFDFSVKVGKTTYLIEVNFYSGGGSKPNEVARSYSEIGPKVNSVPGFEFVWVTDGIGWLSAKNKIEEAFMKLPRVYNLTSVDDFISELRSNDV